MPEAVPSVPRAWGWDPGLLCWWRLRQRQRPWEREGILTGAAWTRNRHFPAQTVDFARKPLQIRSILVDNCAKAFRGVPGFLPRVSNP